MRLSVVMPSHNRLHLLKDAIETVRMQSVENWQLVVFDNYSDEPIRNHVDALNDSRILFKRSEEFLPVTESWNQAMALADGEYCVLLGDDDGLLPDAIKRLTDIVREFDNPDFVYADIYQFWHRGVAPWRPSPHLVHVRHGFFFAGKSQPFKLSAEESRRAVVGSLDLEINFSFNSQACFYSRSFVDRLTTKDGFFRSPFPDYYIANAAIALSGSTVILPEPLAFAGVSKASYGFTLYNNEQGRGDSLLNIKYERDSVYREMKGALLPGPTYNTNFILAMEHVARCIRSTLRHPVAFDRYRRMQIVAVLRDRPKSDAVWAEMWGHLTPRDRVWAAGLQLLLIVANVSPRLKRWLSGKLDKISSFGGSPPMPIHSPDLDCGSAVDVYEAFRAGRAM